MFSDSAWAPDPHVPIYFEFKLEAPFDWIIEPEFKRKALPLELAFGP